MNVYALFLHIILIALKISSMIFTIFLGRPYSPKITKIKKHFEPKVSDQINGIYSQKYVTKVWQKRHLHALVAPQSGHEFLRVYGFVTGL